MDESFSSAAQRLVGRARWLARELGLASTGTRELFSALLDDLQSEAGEIFRGASIQVDALRSHFPIVSDSSQNDERTGATPLPPWDEHARSVLLRAQEIAVRYTRWESTTSQEILIAILEDPGELSPLLKSAGLDASRIVREFHRRREPSVIGVAEADLDWPAAPTENIDIGRILDANANRAREGLRVVEEYARLLLGHTSITTVLKEARHQLHEIMARFPITHLVAARDMESDVGMELSTPNEQSRPDLASVATANIKRVQEALRTIEEYGKRIDAATAQSARRLRYGMYAMERQLFAAECANARLAGANLYWLCDPWACQGSVEWTLREALDGGVQVVQLRDKQSTDRERLDLAHRIREWTLERGAVFIVNDRPDIAHLARADGVHLGQDDLSVREARRIVGPDLLIGVSTHDERQFQNALAAGADYIGVGPVFPSHTKAFDFYPGLAFIERVCPTSPIPAFAIGGIKPSNVDSVLAAGARRVAVGHAIASAVDPHSVARQLSKRLSSVDLTTTNHPQPSGSDQRV